jgi:hypothetical protein
LPPKAEVTSSNLVGARQYKQRLSEIVQERALTPQAQSSLPECCPDVSATLTATAFDRSSLRWLEIST